jgi:nicotinate-nucleotide adenylyltransferase
MNPPSVPVVALFGGTFDPPHVGHTMAVAYLLAAEEVDAVWIEPVAHHPLDKQPTAFEHRRAMCDLAFGWLDDRVSIRDDEVDVAGQGRTIDLLRHLKARHPQTCFRLVMGSDQLADRHRWLAFDEVMALAPPIVLGRPGYADAAGFEAAVDLPAISSSEIRAALGRGDSVQGQVSVTVLDYIERAELYRGAST